MADLMKPALAAAVSMLGLSLGVTDAAAQTQPGVPTGETQGVLIGLDKPDSNSNQIKSEQVKGQVPVSNQWKSPASNQLKAPSSTQLKAPSSNQWKAPSSNQIKW
jgi:hypothetical protein